MLLSSKGWKRKNHVPDRATAFYSLAGRFINKGRSNSGEGARKKFEDAVRRGRSTIKHSLKREDGLGRAGCRIMAQCRRQNGRRRKPSKAKRESWGERRGLLSLGSGGGAGSRLPIHSLTSTITRHRRWKEGWERE